MSQSFPKTIDDLETDVRQQINQSLKYHKKSYDELKRVLQNQTESLPGLDDLTIEQVNPKNMMYGDSIKNIKNFEVAIRTVLIRGVMRDWLDPDFSKKYERFRRFFTKKDIKLDDQEMRDLTLLSTDLLLPSVFSKIDFDTSFTDVSNDVYNEVYKWLPTQFDQPLEVFIQMWRDQKVNVMWYEWLYSNRTSSQVPEVLRIQRLSLPDLHQEFNNKLINMKNLVIQQRSKERNLARSLTKKLVIFDDVLMKRGVKKTSTKLSFYEKLMEALLDW